MKVNMKVAAVIGLSDSGVIKYAGTRTASPAGIMILSVFFWASCCWWSESLFGQSFSVAPPIQELRGLPFLGSFSVVWHVRHIAGPSLESYSVDQCIKHLKGHPGWRPALWVRASGFWSASLSVVQLPMLACGEREAMVMAPPPMHDSAALPYFHGYLVFLHRDFPPQSPLSHPLDLSLHSEQQPLPWDFSTTPELQLPAAAPSRGPVSLSGICMAAARTVWFSFLLCCPISAVLLSAWNVSPLIQIIASMWVSDPCFCSLTHQRQVQSY